MLKKTETTQLIKKILSEKVDPAGNRIITILSSQNEFIIYEIDTEDINNRLKVLIDGHTDDSENELIKKFDAVKQNYVRAKGMLYRSPNYGSMKNRVAHALSTCLSSSNTNFDGNKIFNDLCKEIEQEQKLIVTNSFLYILPVVLSVIIIFLLTYQIIDQRINNTPDWQIASALLASALGTGVSMTTNIKKIHFEEYIFSRFYFFIGIERVIFGFMVAAVAFIAIKSQLITSTLLGNSYWSSMMIFVTAGFAEKFVPSLIKKVDA